MADETITEEKGDEQDGESTESEEEKGGEENDEEEEEIEIKDDFEPPTRKSPLSYIIDRKNKQIEKLKTHTEIENEGGESEEEKKFFGKLDKVIENKMSPILDTFKSQTDDTEIKEFLSIPDNSHFKKYEKIARKYMEHPAYVGVPIENLFQMLDYKNAQLRGAEKKQIIDKKNKKTKVGSSSGGRKESTPPDFKGMSDKEFQAVQKRVLKGEQIKIEE